MKHTFLVIAMLSLVVTATANPITPARAKSIAAGYMKNAKTPVRVIRSAEANARTAGSIATSAEDEQQQPLYIYNRGEGDGFVIVSGDDCLPEVLGYTEGGDYNETLMPPALLGYIQYYADMIAEVQNNGSTTAAPRKARLLDEDVPAILTTDWVQGTPYNNLCPQRTDGGGHALTGCVATATSQITYYWGKQGYCNRCTQYNTPMYDYGEAPVTYSIPAGTPLRWELMGSTTSTASKEALATLNFVTGVCAWLTYGSSTGGYIWDEINVMANQYGLNGGTSVQRSLYNDTKWMTMCANELQEGHPILYSGYTTDWTGHAFVMDGYKYENEENKFHFNYGWGSGWDGFFTLDDCRGYGTGQFMVYGIEPIEFDLEETFTVPENLLKYNYVTASVNIKNNATNIVHGLHLVPCYDTSNPPCSLDDAIASRNTDFRRSTGAINMEGTFLSSGKNYVIFYLMDNRCRIVAQSEKYALGTATAALVLKSLSLTQKPIETFTRTIMVSGKETEIQAERVSELNDSIYAHLSNTGKTGTTSCVPRVCLDLYEYNEETQSFPSVAVRDTAYVEFESGGENTAKYGVRLKPNTLYKAVVYKRIADPTCTLSDPDNLNQYYFQTTDGTEVVRGDANGDSKVSMADVMYIVNYILNNQADDFNKEGADANLDGNITMADAMYNVNYVLNGTFPSENADAEAFVQYFKNKYVNQ